MTSSADSSAPFLDALPTKWSEDDYLLLAVDLLLAVMRSASTDKIRPIDWWSRGKSALEVAAAQAETFSHLVSRMGAKLQIEAFRAESSKEISSLGRTLKDGDFIHFRDLCQRDALYIAALAQAHKAALKEATSV